jgi:hypothetical protein
LNFQEIFDTFFNEFCPKVTENKSAKGFSLIAIATMGQKLKFLARLFFFENEFLSQVYSKNFLFDVFSEVLVKFYQKPQKIKEENAC